jgi:multidrug transporter EmrE-like cation transporter
MDLLWAYLSVCELFITSFSLILTKYLTNTQFDFKILLAIIYILVGVAGVIYLITQKNSKEFKDVFKNAGLFIVVLLMVSACFRIFGSFIIAKALKIAPNIGYCHLIVNLNVVLSLLAGYFLFKQKINTKTFIGIIIALFGVGIVVYHSND